jgi:hypothetical protein
LHHLILHHDDHVVYTSSSSSRCVKLDVIVVEEVIGIDNPMLLHLVGGQLRASHLIGGWEQGRQRSREEDETTSASWA